MNRARYTRTRVVGGLLIFSLLLMAGSGCDDDKGVGPRQPKEYAVYFMENYYETGNWFFRYVPATNEIDSTYLNYGYGYVVSADGEKMYIRDRKGGDLDILKLPTFEKIGELPYTSALAVSPDNRYMAVYNGSLTILSTPDYSVVYDTIMPQNHLWNPQFSADSRTFYSSSVDTLYGSHFLDNNRPPERYAVPYGVIYDAAVSPDERQIYYYVKIPDASWNFFFLVFDRSVDSLVFQLYLTPGSGNILPAPDGQLVYFTNTGNLSSMSGDPYISVYDVAQNQLIDPISSVGLMDEPYEYGMDLWHMYITPDGRWLVTLPYLSYPGVLTADLSKREMVHYRVLSQTWNDGLDGPKLP